MLQLDALRREEMRTFLSMMEAEAVAECRSFFGRRGGKG